MSNDREAELKQVQTERKAHPEQLRRDPTMSGGERAETPVEKENRERRKEEPKEPPIIQRDVT